MIPDTSNVEEGFHSSPTSPQNTKKTTDGEALSSITSRWRHKRSTIFVAVTVITVSIALSVGVVLSSRRNKHVKQEVNPMAASGGHDDTTIIAEASSGDHRSSIIGQCNVVQELEAPQIDASSAKVAIDGKNLVVVSHGAMQYGYDPHLDGDQYDPGSVEPDEFNVYVDFYSLTDNGWEKIAGFQENNIRASYWDYGQRNVALSGKTSVVTFPSDDGSDRPVYTYRQNDDGIWNKVSLNLPDEGGACLRESVDVDQDLMVTFDETLCGYTLGYNSAHIYKRSGGSWAEAGEITFDEQPDIFNVYQVALSGDTLAVQVFDTCYFVDASEGECYINIYKYNREFGTITLDENFIGLPGSKCSPMVFDGNYLVHGLSVYHKPGIHDNEPFSLLTTAYPSPASGMVPTGYGKSLALDNGILVVGSDDRTYIFDLQNGAIGEEISLDQKPNTTHEISDGILVTSNQDVFGVTILNCKQPFPAQTPCPTEAPPTQHSTALPSSYPTYFGTSLGAGIERTFAPTPAPTFVGSMPINLLGLPSTMAYCSSEEECRDYHDGSFSQFVSGNYRNYGCFSKGGTLYWGKGGTSEQEMNDSDFLDGMKERVFCVWN